MEWISILRYFYILGAANALFFSFLIFSKTKRKLADKLLSFWLIVLSLQLLTPFLYLSDLQAYYQFAGIEATFYFIHPIMLYLYIKAMINQFPPVRNLISIIATGLIMELSIFAYFIIPAKERLDLLLERKPILPIYYLFFVPIIIFFIVYFILSLKTLKDYKLKVLQIYSYKENVDLLWLRGMVLFFYSLLICAMALGIIFYFVKISLANGDYFYFAGLMFFIFFLGFWQYKQDEVSTLQTIIKKDKENTTPMQIKTIVQKIQKEKVTALKIVMEEKKPYLNPTLTIYELANLIDIQSHQLSKLIHQEYNCNFYEFVNQYRIESVKQSLLSENNKEFTLLAIAYDCGFNSKSAFNRIFKEQTGLTPGEFKKKYHPNKVLKN